MANTVARSSKLAVAIAGLFPALVGAGNWQFTPTLTVLERYSDNISLTNADQESSFMTEVTPGFKLHGTGGRGHVSVDYGLQGLLYTHDGNANTLNNRLNAVLHTEILEDVFFLDATARVGQQHTSLVRGAVGIGNYNPTGNRAETRAVSVTPSWRGRLGSTLDWDARWQLTYADSDRAIQGTTGSNVSVGVKSGSEFHQIPWSVSYTLRHYDGGTSATRYSSMSGTAGYVVSPKTRLNLTVGRDSNNGGTSIYNKVGGAFWNIGLNWSPTLRTSLSANAGYRHGGDSYGLNFSHRTRKTNWGVSYREFLEDTFSQITGTGAFDIYQCGASLVIVPVGSGSPDPLECGIEPALPAQLLDSTELVDQTTLQKRWSATASYKTGKSLFTGSFHKSNRMLLNSGESDDYYSLAGNWTLQLGPRTASTVSLYTISAESKARQNDTWTIAWILSRAYSKKATGALELRRLERDDELSTGNYTENSLMARVNLSF